ncbi:MAG: hypothetical protein QF718_04790 [Phycisphaerales bacterium]|jgi:hypothetical protein|nr:hypothetical protein [Phycisphaerales bacterium]
MEQKRERVSVGIAPDDLGVGEFVAIIEPKTKQKLRMMMGRDEDGDPIMMPHPEQPRQCTAGVPHKVLGISWPWAVFGVLMPGGKVDGPIIHDLRKIKCMRLDDSYVNAIHAFQKPEVDSKAEEPEMPF